MKFAKIALTFLFACKCALVGCATGQSNERHSPKTFQESTLLWKVVSGQGAVNYVFGTIHLPDSTVFRQRDTVLTLMRSSRTFMAELNLDSMFSMAAMGMMMLPPDKSLADFFTPDEMVEVRAALQERLGPMAFAAERMKPGAIVGLLMMDTAGATAGTTMDQYLWEEAQLAGCTTGGIEQLREQLALLDSIPPRIILEALRDTGTSDEIDRLAEAYAREDLAAVVALVDSVSELESFMLQMNDQRNVRMAKRLKPLLDQGRTFIAIGAAHLGGKQGLLAELDKMGYVVTPVLGGRRSQWLE